MTTGSKKRGVGKVDIVGFGLLVKITKAYRTWEIPTMKKPKQK